jgi:hypothetical protein
MHAACVYAVPSAHDYVDIASSQGVETGLQPSPTEHNKKGATMRRIAAVCLFVFSLLLACAGGFLSARDRQQSKPSTPKKEPTWTQIAPDQWRTELDTGEPDIAVLRLSDAEYKEFFKAPKDYFNDHHVFPKKVNKAEAAGEDPPPTATGWIVVGVHTPYSTVSYVAWPEP